MRKIFEYEKILNFVKNQMAAGKSKYIETQFIQAFSEIELLAYLCQEYYCHIEKADYEPAREIYSDKGEKDANKNTEAFFEYQNGTRIFIEVKTPEFTNLEIPSGKEGIIQPNILWDMAKRDEYDSELEKSKLPAEPVACSRPGRPYYRQPDHGL